MAPDAKARLIYTEADIRKLEPGRQFDVVVSLFHVICYQTSDSDLRVFFANVRASLAEGGFFQFDFWYGPAVLRDPPKVSVKRMTDIENEVVRTGTSTLDPSMNRVNIAYEIAVTDRRTGDSHNFHETHSVRYLFEPELLEMMREAGLEPVAMCEWGSGNPASEDTRNVYCIAYG